MFSQTSSEGWVVGQIMYYYKDGVWSDYQEYPGANYYNSISLTDTLHGWAVGVNGKIIFTVNGFHWNGQANSDENTLNDVFFINPNEGWAVGQEVLLHTTNGGSTWVPEAQDLTAEKLFTAVFSTDNLHVYVAGNDGTLLKYCEITGIETSAEKSFSISPNPCRDVLMLHFNDYLPVPVKITIVNLLGMKLKELTGTGTKQQLNISNLPEGTYFVLVDDGKNHYSGKFMVLK